MEKLFASPEAAKELGVDRTTTFRAAAAGLVPGARREPRPGTINAPWVAPLSAWREWYENRRGPGRPVKGNSAVPPKQGSPLLRPALRKTETIAEIVLEDTNISVIFPERREDFRILIRSLGYRWMGAYWYRVLRPYNGSPTDRAAETGHRLLAAGFPIEIQDEVTRTRAAVGCYEPEPKCSVMRLTSGEHKDWFKIGWPRDEDLYGAAKRLAGSRYVPKVGIVVPAENFDEVLDFAEIHRGFVSPGAQALAREAKAAREASLVVNVPHPKKRAKTASNPQPPTLEQPEEVTIADDLRDEDETP